jgi:oligopeptidase B
VKYSVANHGGYFYIHTNDNGAYNFKVVTAPVDDPSNKSKWEEVLPHREDVLVEHIDLFRHHFVAWEWEGGLQKVRVQDLSDGGNFGTLGCWINNQ